MSNNRSKKLPTSITSNEAPVPIIRWTSNFIENNFNDFRNKLENYSLEHFGQLGKLFINEKYYIPKIPPPQEKNLELKTNYEIMMRQRETQIQILDNDKLKLDAFMYRKLSKNQNLRLSLNQNGKPFAIKQMHWDSHGRRRNILCQQHHSWCNS
jgi:hypothetical protein